MNTSIALEVEPEVIFTVKSKKTGKKGIVVNSTKNFDELNKILDDVSSAKMLAKAEVEENPYRKKMMLLYAKCKAEIEWMESQ